MKLPRMKCLFFRERDNITSIDSRVLEGHEMITSVIIDIQNIDLMYFSNTEQNGLLFSYCKNIILFNKLINFM